MAESIIDENLMKKKEKKINEPLRPIEYKHVG